MFPYKDLKRTRGATGREEPFSWHLVSKKPLGFNKQRHRASTLQWEVEFLEPWALVTRCRNSNAAASSHGAFISVVLRENINRIKRVRNSVNCTSYSYVNKNVSYLGRIQARLGIRQVLDLLEKMSPQIKQRVLSRSKKVLHITFLFQNQNFHF